MAVVKIFVRTSNFPALDVVVVSVNVSVTTSVK